MKRLLVLFALLAMSVTASAQDKPNILVIWGDDVGQSNISAYTMGMMGYRTDIGLPCIVSLAIGIMIWRDWPLPGEQMLGIYIGAKLLVDGIVMLVIGRGARAIDEALGSQG